MFRRILVANRGEIALRVIRACRELGVETVAVYSEADRGAAHVRLADAAVCIGPASPRQSYLQVASIISAAEVANVDAIHPGYGFLAENPHFAEVCRDAKIEFIGPPVEAMQVLGDKARARALAAKAGVRCVPGSAGPVGDEQAALDVVRKVGYPVLIKAVAGGGGRGMRIVHNDISLVNAIMAARSEAEAAFGDGSVYMEKFIERPRHIEIQVLADKHGSIVHLGERDCSIQRRYQKLVEEAPSPTLSHDLRKKMGRAALRIAHAAGYAGAGTVEFLVAGKEFYFIEANARIQVEHPVSEMVTGIDIVREQIRLAAGEPLGYRQDDVKLRGAAIECRINAEDPEDGFRPSPGRITDLFQPGGMGVRVDSHIFTGYTVPPHYDSLVAKLIVHRSTRDETVRTMRRALDEYRIEGIKTTLPMLRRVLRSARFASGEYDTTFLEETR